MQKQRSRDVLVNTLCKQLPIRDKKYLDWIKSLPCVVCLSKHYYHISEPHHIPLKGNSGKGTKTDDTRAIPLCNNHHSEYHQHGRDTFSIKYNLDYEESIERLNKIYESRQLD